MKAWQTICNHLQVIHYAVDKRTKDSQFHNIFFLKDELATFELSLSRFREHFSEGWDGEGSDLLRYYPRICLVTLRKP